MVGCSSGTPVLAKLREEGCRVEVGLGYMASKTLSNWKARESEEWGRGEKKGKGKKRA